jgi:FkbM family methyltransferase|tara:strand:+ start:1029 stop:1592 length:564 start_codon:yes stop_codon:yes gene_type:complete
MPTYEYQLKIWKEFYNWCKPYIVNFNNAIDVGCDTFGFAKWLEDDFNHIYCFDFRNKKAYLKEEVKDTSKFTYFNTGLGESKSIKMTKSGVGRIKGTGNLKVNVETLDSFNLKDISFIKLDVEGYEEKILRGGINTIQKYKPILVIEQNRGDFSAQKLVESWNYKLIGIWNVNDKPHDYLFQYNLSI